MTKHTPAPWHRNIRANGKYPVIYAGRNTHVAMAKGHDYLPPEEIEANIDLIAAAPELLEALKNILSYEISCPKTIQEQATRAIIKAEGK